MLDDGAVKTCCGCCCAPLTPFAPFAPFAPMAGVVEFMPEKKFEVDCALENKEAVEVEPAAGVLLRDRLPLASRILRWWSAGGQN